MDLYAYLNVEMANTNYKTPMKDIELDLHNAPISTSHYNILCGVKHFTLSHVLHRRDVTPNSLTIILCGNNSNICWT